MKSAKLWVIVVFTVILISGVLVAFAKQGFEVIPLEPSQAKNYIQPPENATIIPGFETIPFDLYLDTHEITISRERSMNMTVMVYAPEKVNLLLTVGTEDHVPDLALIGLQPELPSGITASLDQTEISVEAGLEVAVNLTLSIGDQTTPGTYTLHIFAIQKTSYGGTAAGVPFQLTIP